MSTLPAAELGPPLSLRRPGWVPPLQAGIAVVLSLLGISAIWPTVLFLWGLWTTDPLKSVGMLIPLVSLVLILRVWRAQGWQMRGTWWGFTIVAATALAVQIREQAVLVFVLAPQWSIYIPPHSLVALSYAAGTVLLFGGQRLLRGALFPVCLMGLVNPVPHIFNVFVDLPLQRVSAHVARGFAMALGQKLSPDQMRLMFTPEFGMFIAPGCNGIRGAVTMGLIALIVGHLYRFQWRLHVAFVAGAVLLGYIFNFLRLCSLVVYYIVALHITGLQDHGEMADYILGACLFLLATFLLISTVRRLAAEVHLEEQSNSRPLQQTVTTAATASLRLTAMLLMVLLGFGTVARAYVSERRHPAPDASVLGDFPQNVGAYARVRSWNEYATAGPLIFQWADYAPEGSGIHVALGISPVLGSHDTLICHSARGEDPLWHAQFTVPTVDSTASNFSASFFNDGATQYLEVTTVCNGGRCGEYSADRNRLGFVYSRPSPSGIFSHDPQRAIPIMLRAETLDTTMPPDVARSKLTASMKVFLASLSLRELTSPYQHP